MNKLIIIGDGEFAEIAYEYFTHDSDYDVIGFAVEKEYLKKDTLYDLPVVAFENIEQMFPPNQYEVFIAVTFTQLNRVRTRLYETAKKMGYRCASYISSKAFVWHNATIGENCFIFENNVIQHFVSIGNNVILWSGNHVGHRASIEDNCFISSHVVISGYCKVGKNCFVGVNSTFIDNISIGDDCFVGAGCFLSKSIEEGNMCKAPSPTRAEISRLSSFRFFKIDEKRCGEKERC
jgi:sugar O-acyltransferase (sialic acid O-acetyltransferase NeuD family)